MHNNAITEHISICKSVQYVGLKLFISSIVFLNFKHTTIAPNTLKNIITEESSMLTAHLPNLTLYLSKKCSEDSKKVGNIRLPPNIPFNRFNAPCTFSLLKNIQAIDKIKSNKPTKYGIEFRI